MLLRNKKIIEHVNISVISCLVPLCLWISFVFCTQVCPSHELHVCVERHGPNNSSPWIISDAYCCRPVIFPCSISGTSLSGSTVSLLLLSFTLNQASASSNHSIVPSRGNGKFTCLGWFVRGCFLSLALLIRFLDLWFVEWIIIKVIHRKGQVFYFLVASTSGMVPAYHSHLWYLSCLEQYFALLDLGSFPPLILSLSCSRHCDSIFSWAILHSGNSTFRWLLEIPHTTNWVSLNIPHHVLID